MLERKNLIFRYGDTDEVLLARIDETGGWPVGYAFLKFFHGSTPDERYCAFSDNSLNSGWWTTVLSADDYYWWKLSSERKSELVAKARMQLISKLHVLESNL